MRFFKANAISRSQGMKHLLFSFRSFLVQYCAKFCFRSLAMEPCLPVLTTDSIPTTARLGVKAIISLAKAPFVVERTICHRQALLRPVRGHFRLDRITLITWRELFPSLETYLVATYGCFLYGLASICRWSRWWLSVKREDWWQVVSSPRRFVWESSPPQLGSVSPFALGIFYWPLMRLVPD